MHLTVGTAFTITIFTSTVSVITHHKNKLVDLSVVKTFGIFVVIGVLIGTFFASIMKTKMLVLFFSIVVYVFGAYLMLAQEKIKKIRSKVWKIPCISLSTHKTRCCIFKNFIVEKFPSKIL